MLTTAFFPSLTSEGNLTAYINKVQKFPILSAEEEDRLAQNWFYNHNLADAHKLVTSHLRLVVKIAISFKNYGLPLLDLIMEGNIGLMQAIKKFDPSLGFRLSTYAIWWIKASIKDYILKTWSFVKVGTTQAQRKLFFNLRKIRKKITKFHVHENDNNYLSDQDAKIIAEECSVTVKEVENMNKRLSQKDKSLNDFISYNNDEGNIELQDIIASKTLDQEKLYLKDEDKRNKKELINKALLMLNDRYRDIFIRRRLLEEPETLEQLSKKYNVSKERIRQIEALAFNKVKTFIEANKNIIGY